MLNSDLHVLLIGDFGTNQEQVRLALHNAAERPPRVEGASSGTEGLAHYREQRPDLIFLDLDLPDISPVALLEALHNHDEGGMAVPVILVAEPDHKHVQPALVAGAYDVVHPDQLRSQQLEHLLDRVTAHARGLREPVATQSDNFVDSMPIMLWMIGADKRCTFVNQRWLEFTGRTFEQELGFGWMESMHPDDVQRCQRLFDERFEARQPAEMEYRLRRYDGVYRWVMDQALPRFNAEGTLLGYTGSSIDISKQKRTEAELRFLSEASTLLSASLDVEMTLQKIAELAVPRIADWCIVFGVTPDGDVQRQFIKFANAAKKQVAERLARYPLDDVNPVVVAIRTGEPRLIRRVSDHFLSSFAQSDEHLQVLRDMGVYSYMVVPMAARGHAVGAIAFGISEIARHFEERDLLFAVELARSAAIAFDNARLYVEQRRSEVALRQSAAQSRRQLAELQAIYATAPAGLCFVDARYRFVSINETLARMNGHPVAEHIGRTFRDMLPSPVALEIETICQRVFENGHPALNVEVDVQTGDSKSEQRYWLSSFYPVRGAEGAILGVNIVAQDITDRKRRELHRRFLADLDSQLRQIPEPKTIVWTVVSALGDYFDLVFCSFSDVEPDEDRIRIHHDWRRDAPSVAGTYQLSTRLSEPFINQARAGQTILVHDTATDPRTVEIYATEDIPLNVRAFLILPYLRDNDWVAVLIAADDTPRAWRHDEVALVESVATRAWQALQRARAEQALREAAEQRRLALDSAQMGAWGIDYSTGAIYWDERSRAIFGMEIEDKVTANALTRHVHELDKARVEHAIEYALDPAGSGRYQEEFRIRWPDNTVRWVTVRGQAYFDGEGDVRAVARFTGTVMDVTERKEAEEALRESEQRFRSTFEQAAVGISHVALDGSWLRVNQRLCDILGYTREEMLQKTFHDITHPDDLAEDIDNMQRVLSGQSTSYAMEKRYFHKTGRIVWINLTVSLVRVPENGEPLYLISVIEDISDRKEAEDALRQSEERFRVTLKNTPIVVYNTDRELRYTWIYNPQGFEVEDVIGKRDDELLPAEQVAELIQFKQEVLRRSVGMRREIPIMSGEALAVYDVTAEPLFDSNGDVIGLTVAAMDISERKRYEKALQALNETLEQRVKERTKQVRKLASELTLAEQRERRRIARTLHDDVQQMLYGLQINTLVMERELASTASPDLQQHLEEMQQLINQIIDANRTLTVELSPPVIKANRLEEAFEWLLMHLEEHYDLHVDLTVKGDCHVPDDDLRELVFQLVRELLLNVVKHAGVHRAKLSLMEAEGCLITQVEDDGVGFDVAGVIAAQNGFGLYSVQERLNLFGGQLEIESHPGQGTRIIISVPLSLSDLSLAD